MVGIIAKGIVELTVGLGVSSVIQNAVLATTPANLCKAEKVLVVIGSSVLGSVVGHKAIGWVDEQFEELGETIENMKENHRVKKELKKQEKEA